MWFMDLVTCCLWALIYFFFSFFQKLEVDSDDSYLDREWTDPQSLKKQFSGLGNISWKPK